MLTSSACLDYNECWTGTILQKNKRLKWLLYFYSRVTLLGSMVSYQPKNNLMECSGQCLIYRNCMQKCIMNAQYIRFFLIDKNQQLPKEMGLCGVSSSLSLWLSASFFSSLER